MKDYITFALGVELVMGMVDLLLALDLSMSLFKVVCLLVVVGIIYILCHLLSYTTFLEE